MWVIRDTNTHESSEAKEMHLSKGEKLVGAVGTFNECNGFSRLNATV